MGLRGQDSNLRPSGYEPAALPLSYHAECVDGASPAKSAGWVCAFEIAPPAFLAGLRVDRLGDRSRRWGHLNHRLGASPGIPQMQTGRSHGPETTKPTRRWAFLGRVSPLKSSAVATGSGPGCCCWTFGRGARGEPISTGCTSLRRFYRLRGRLRNFARIEAWAAFTQLSKNPMISRPTMPFGIERCPLPLQVWHCRFDSFGVPAMGSQRTP